MSEDARAGVLVAGHYCHDTIVGKDGGRHEVLGGSAAYSAAVLGALGVDFRVVAKVGADFRYRKEVVGNPIVAGDRTTSFIDDYSAGERVETLEAVCAPILAGEVGFAADVTIACPIAGELPAATLLALRASSRLLVADVQGLIRCFGPRGEVTNRPLAETPYAALIDKLDYLKVSASEARVLNLEVLCRDTRVIVTHGAAGSTLYGDGPPQFVPAFAAEEKDGTGAGDCFLAGFAAGLHWGWPASRALRLASFCGAKAVEQIGIPKLSRPIFAGLL